MRRLNRNGVPYVCVIITMCIACLSYLSVSAGVSFSDTTLSMTSALIVHATDCTRSIMVDLPSNRLPIVELDLHVNNLAPLQQCHEGSRS